MTQYTLKIGKTVLHDPSCICTTLKAIKRVKKEFESANKTYDIPNPEKIRIVSREVTEWKVCND